MGRTALVLGATGLVGRELIYLLLDGDEFSTVISIARRKLADNGVNPKLKQKLADFENLAKQKSHFASDAVFICLGTTIAKAGSKAAFNKVDYEYVVEAARLSAEQGAGHLLVISALGANPNSSIFYNQVKGNMELAISLQAIPHITIFRPSLLSGNREEARSGERIGLAIARFVAPLLTGSLRKYRHISATTVARAMIRTAVSRNDEGVRIIQSDEIARLGA